MVILILFISDDKHRFGQFPYLNILNNLLFYINFHIVLGASSVHAETGGYS